ncbi:PorV/PorQ family protein [candidate division WOR-3 bacterium]|nr:PorV/PorQ family protein [candidate division WOR-3 bacterium]
MKKFIVFISLLIFVLSLNAYAQDKVAQTGCGFLDVAEGARACGMGQAFTVLGQDASALFYNPSGIGEIEANFDLSAGGTQWIADINYLYVAGVFNAGVWGNFGFSVIAPDYGEIFGTRVDSTVGAGFINTGLVDVSAFCAGVAYAREFTDKFTVGGQVKYVAQHLGSNLFQGAEAGVIDTVENEISTLSYDFGLLFYPGFKSFAFGMSVRNFSPRVTYERIGFELPLTFALGVGMDILDIFGEYPDYSFNIAADMLHPRDWEEQYNVGAELSYKNMIFLRAGYKFNYYAEGLNAGVGISMAGVRIDYSYSEHDLYDMVNRASVGFSF